MMAALDLVFAWAKDWMGSEDDWWGEWRRIEPDVLKRLKTCSKQFQ